MYFYLIKFTFSQASTRGLLAGDGLFKAGLAEPKGSLAFVRVDKLSGYQIAFAS